MTAGIDVSHYQSPAAVPWKTLAAVGGFCIVRMTYGVARDERAAEHVARARAAGVRVGAYHFFRASQPVAVQLGAFRGACSAADYGHPTDIVPAVDWEDDTSKAPITPAQSPLVEEFCGELAQAFGQRPLLYITQRDWGRVGSPAWALEHDLWVAHYSAASRQSPATPGGRPWAIWQHRVGPLELAGPHGYYQPATYDHNLAQVLPLLNGTRLGDAAAAQATHQAPELDEHHTEALRADLLATLAREGVAESHAAGMREMAAEEA
ncbi:MAG TPA: glycoside hydrolase family 25 protein [Gammaproteobacteria bacterium]|nr:glycoside hydrolase family 25 protein [Gammaproteobacteria bacterium]